MTKKERASAMDFLSGLSESPPIAINISIKSIRPDPNQPRKEFDEEKLNNIAASIKEVGILQPITLRETNEEIPYIILDGECRWRAAQKAGLEEIPGFLRNDLTGDQVALSQIIANANRNDLTDIEMAKSIQAVLNNNLQLKKKDVAALFNRPNSFISRLLAMLDKAWEPLVEEGIIKLANVLERLKSLDTTEQEELIMRARTENRAISRADIDELLSNKRANKTNILDQNLIGKLSTEIKAELPLTADLNINSDLDNFDHNASTSITSKPKDSYDNISEQTPNDVSNQFEAEEYDPAQPPTSEEVSGKDQNAICFKPVVLKLTIDELERLIPFFVDKDKQIEITCNEQTAKQLLQNLGSSHIDDASNYTDLVKELIS